MIFHGVGNSYWTDENDEMWMPSPNVVITAAEMASFIQNYGFQDMQKLERKVLYTDNATSRKYMLVLSFFVMPAGAPNVTINVAGTSQIEGKFMLETGALSGARADRRTIAGLLFPFYYNQDKTTDYVSVLSAGDGFWVVRDGPVELTNDNVGPTAVGDIVVTGASAGGDIGTAIGAAYAQAAAEDTTVKYVGGWEAIVASTAVGRANISLGHRYSLT